MKKVLFCLGIALCALNVQADGMVVDYHFGSQISASYLQIMSDGTVNVRERIMPPFADPVPEVALTASQMAVLSNLIEKARIAEITQVPFSAALGISTGYLKVYSGDDEIVIRDYQWSSSNLNGTLRVNASPEARELEKFVNKYVKCPMPDLTQ